MLDSLPLQIRERCLYYLYTICSHQALVPRSLEIPLCYNPEDIPHSRTRLAEVWKGRHNGQDVAVEVLKMNLRDNLDKAKRVSSPRFFAPTDEFTAPRTDVLQGGRDVEVPSTPERVASVRRYGD